MNKYSPLWSQVCDSSLWCEPDHVVKVFLTMIAKKDLDDVVRGSAFNISNWARKTEAETLDALKILSSPDTKRIEPQPFEGRRIEKVAEGWFVLNGAYYRKMMGLATRREYKRLKMAEYRQRDEDRPREPMTPAQKATFEKAKAKEKVKRRKNFRRAGAIAGANEELVNGFEHQKQQMAQDDQIDAEHNGEV